LKTEAFLAIVAAGRASEDDDLADVLEIMGKPAALTLEQIAMKAANSNAQLETWLNDPRSRKAIPHRMETAGYERVRNPDDAEGRWRIRGPKRTIYARADLLPVDRLAAARRLAAGHN
jgi:TusA-related sulfurtransferase